jgi:hypothetical protein
MAKSCAGTAFLKQVIEGKLEGKEDEEEDVNGYWIILRKG